MLDTLPAELIVDILSYIDYSDTATLHALCLTSRRFYELSVERLYARVPGRNPVRFLERIALPPRSGNLFLADCVKEIVWRHGTREHRQALRRFVQRIGLKKKLRSSLDYDAYVGCDTKLIDDIRSLPAAVDYHWWLLKFFMLFVPNVERIEIHDAWQWEDHIYWFDNLENESMRLSNLKSITIYGPLRLDNVLPLLKLPALRTLELVQVLDMRRNPDEFYPWNIPENGKYHLHPPQLVGDGSPIEHLILRDCDSDMRGLVHMMRVIKALKSFTQEHRPDQLSERYSHHPSYRWLRQCLAFQRDSLEYLRLRFTACMGAPDHEFDAIYIARDGGWHDDFQFTKLQTMDITVHSFTVDRYSHLVKKQGNVLPRSLETLRLSWIYYPEPGRDDLRTNSLFQDPANQLQSLIVFLRDLAEKKVRLSVESPMNLKEVVLVDWPTLDGHPWYPLPTLPKELSSLRALYEECGIRLSFPV